MDGIDYDVVRWPPVDEDRTTVYVVRYPREQTRVRVAWFSPMRRLDDACTESGVSEALVGGFFWRPDQLPLGEVWIAGGQVPCVPFPSPWDQKRPAIHVHDNGSVDESLRIERREDLPAEPPGDLLQAGPLLVADGVNLMDGTDLEGFSAASEQFDTDITQGRHPRAALGLNATEIFSVVCDGRRTGLDAGLDLREMGDVLVHLGADRAINLDGGGSTTMVHRRHLVNRPYDAQDMPSPGRREIATALVFEPVSSVRAASPLLR